jgi:hypothetical protein
MDKSVCLQNLMKKIKNSRKLNRVVINNKGIVEPKINLSKSKEAMHSIYHLDYGIDTVVENPLVRLGLAHNSVKSR